MSKKTKKLLKMNEQKLFGFWRYDSYPYILGASIERFTPGGYIVPADFGGRCYKPILILPFNEGKILRERLKNLEVGYERAEKEMRAGWIEALGKIFGEENLARVIKINDDLSLNWVK